jgi:hypothetical protein
VDHRAPLAEPTGLAALKEEVARRWGVQLVHVNTLLGSRSWPNRHGRSS